jgi:hypothetical protein
MSFKVLKTERKTKPMNSMLSDSRLAFTPTKLAIILNKLLCIKLKLLTGSNSSPTSKTKTITSNNSSMNMSKKLTATRHKSKL